jgi:hypothetical protein
MREGSVSIDVYIIFPSYQYPSYLTKSSLALNLHDLAQPVTPAHLVLTLPNIVLLDLVKHGGFV